MKKNIIINSLVKIFNQHKVLKSVDFEVDEGSLISIIGSSGCGKTTLLRCMAFIEFPNAGDIKIDDIVISDEEIKANINSKNLERLRKKNHNLDYAEFVNPELRTKIRKIRSKVGFLFQNLNLFPHKTVLGNVSLSPIIVNKINKEEAEANAEKFLGKVGMLQFKDRYPHELSGGQSQRVAIARSLAMNPKIMLYDEPTSALDPKLALEVLEVMQNLRNEGITQIIVTHAVNFARNASDKVAYMYDGEIIEYNTPEILFENPDNIKTKEYLKVL